MRKSLLVLLAVMLLMVIPTASAQQTWYLANYITSGNYIMDKTPPSTPLKPGSTTVTILPNGGTAVWIADEQAQVDVTFTDFWSGTLKTGSNPSLEVSIGVWDGTQFVPKSSTTSYSVGSSGIISFIIPATTFTVPQGQWLAFQVKNTDTTSNLKIDLWSGTGGGGGTWTSSVTYPQSTPPYPVPELSTIALLGAGLVAVGIGLMSRKD